MTAAEGSIQHRRLRAPRNDGQTLEDPPLRAVPALFAENVVRRSAWNFDFQGRSLAALAATARKELIDLARRYTTVYRDVDFFSSMEGSSKLPPIVLTGHQPPLYHPGVWFKNFCLSSIAKQVRAYGINLLVDNDTLRSASLTIPTGTADEPRLSSVAIDQPSDEIPFEERKILDLATYATFGERAAQAIAPLISDPLVRTLWSLAKTAVARGTSESLNLGRCLSQARHQVEATWGLQTLEVPLSEVCETDSFRWFAIYLMVRLPQFRDVYNQSLEEYRKVNRLRSRSHPVPDLAAEGDWLEAPFWIWSRNKPRRRRVFVRSTANGLEVSDRNSLTFRLDVSDKTTFDTGIEQLAIQSRHGIKFRPRALITLYSRMVLSDLFLHGIGGAKYDQLTDAITRRFFGADPLGFQTLTATFHLPIDHRVVTGDDVRQVDHQLRELQYHPELSLPEEALKNDLALKDLIASKRRWFGEPATRADRIRRYHEVRRVNEALQPFVADTRTALLAQRDRFLREERHHVLFASREFSFCLFPAENLRRALLELSALSP